MQRLDHARRLISLMFSLVLLAVPAALRAQDRPHMGEHDPGMMARHQAMMAEHERTVARMDSLSVVMNGSSGEARTDAMAALLNELVAQHRAMHEHMREMMMHCMGEGHGMKKPGRRPGPEPPAESEPPHSHTD